jgi:hypothetical protein
MCGVIRDIANINYMKSSIETYMRAHWFPHLFHYLIVASYGIGDNSLNVSVFFLLSPTASSPPRSICLGLILIIFFIMYH